MATFKKKPLATDRVVAVQDAASTAPIVGDPRMAPPAIHTEQPIAREVGSSQDSVKYEVGQVYDVPIGKIRSNPFNPRVVYTASAVSEMAASLVARGQGMSAIGYANGEGEVVLIEGETRLRGARAAGLSTLRL
ncbi:ParB N-terminal domain-containing protein, partial [Burkholderia sp.]